ncbi:CpsD/CapB family tyrosine-protein kinase [Paenibacillus ginsengarvi]|uniref:non-specific protein-tyrosine kinase n=1 Tax=Paenibacillus ginsengarvi TaxID=400777 RepID=A0A3B0CKB9_9BACL|nr:CpsD/CapB family tyrosine-protein kinase [Paenibacillus ginsengarvi]RKN85662.1 polysaccharide biosynthesis tyrosine autokinase [Paenibacillus ginsengarvi]
MSVPINKSALVSYLDPMSAASEAYRSLRANLRFGAEDPSTILVTSSLHGEGKTTTVSNLAIAYAQEGHKVILIDAHWKIPRLHQVFSVSNKIGLSDVLLQRHSVDESVCNTSIANLSLLTSGPLQQYSTQLICSDQVISLIEKLRKTYNFIFFDSPPVLQSTDAQIIAALCDGVLLVIKSGKTRQGHIAQAINRLEQIKAPVLGVVLNDKKRSRAISL